MPYAFSLGEIRTGIELQSLQQEPYVISEITVLAPQVFVEINEDNTTSLNVLKKNLSGSSKSSSQEKTQAEDKSSSKQPRLIIRQLTFADGNIQATAAALDNKEYQLKLPSLKMSNLGGDKGATPAELAKEILSRLTDRATEEVKKKIIDAELDKLKARARAELDEEKAKLEEKADAKLEGEKEKVKDKLKGLFGN
jgi:hypothetical protein